ncbi:hypothetical protein [Jiangella endophytica]|uniref:hypothetical protein n=1 Tax=Jiangella endophytica TaxID=1623398 RepID=UPI000E348459|nr:hypothetical protein [Jiangella endophytica]
MNRRQVSPWDAPVVRALDAVEELPGFEPEHVGWDDFRFHGTGTAWEMDTVSIYAYPVKGRGFVRFAATSDGATVTGPGRRELTADQVARALNVPVESAEATVAALDAALALALVEFNAGHAPPARPRTKLRPQQTPPTPPHGADAATRRPPPDIGR